MMITAGIVALGLAAWNTPSKAQGPMYDRVNVNLPYTVTIGDRTLQPGDYVIQQLRDQSGNSRVLLIYSDNGMKFETSAMTIPALDQNTPENTKVVLHHFGNDYYFDKIWIQGKDYGYEFPLPDSVKSRNVSGWSRSQWRRPTRPTQQSRTPRARQTPPRRRTRLRAPRQRARRPPGDEPRRRLRLPTTDDCSVGHDHSVTCNHDQHDDGAEPDDDASRAPRRVSRRWRRRPPRSTNEQQLCRIVPCRTRRPAG